MIRFVVKQVDGMTLETSIDVVDMDPGIDSTSLGVAVMESNSLTEWFNLSTRCPEILMKGAKLFLMNMFFKEDHLATLLKTPLSQKLSVFYNHASFIDLYNKKRDNDPTQWDLKMSCGIKRNKFKFLSVLNSKCNLLYSICTELNTMSEDIVTRGSTIIPHVVDSSAFLDERWDNFFENQQLVDYVRVAFPLGIRDRDTATYMKSNLVHIFRVSHNPVILMSRIY